MKHLTPVLAILFIACTKEQEPQLNYSATEYRIESNVKWVSIHFHNLTTEEYSRFKSMEALGQHKICPEDAIYSIWKVGIDTCVTTSLIK